MSFAERERPAHFLLKVATLSRRRSVGWAGETPALPLLFFNNAHEMPDFGDHPARRRRVRKLADATDAIEAEADKGLALVVAAPDPAAHRPDLDCLPAGRTRCRPWRTPPT